jgi:phosphatidylglycerophosphatase GEP4
MVQSVNTKALMALASIVRRPGLLVPHVTVATISELNYTAMKEHGAIRAVVFDKDNTLTAPYENSIHPSALDGLKQAQLVFGVDNVAILSNSAGTSDDEDYKDAMEIEEKLGIAVIRHEEKKPGGLDSVLEHFSLTDPATICVVGDRILTDVVFGNLYGLLTVHCLPLCSGPENDRDNWTAKLIRPVENKMMYADWFVGRALDRRRIEHKYWKGSHIAPLKYPAAEPTSICGKCNTTDQKGS